MLLIYCGWLYKLLKNWLNSKSVKAALLEGIADEILTEFDFGDLEPKNVEFPKQCT